MLGLMLKDYYALRRRYLILIGFMALYALLFNGERGTMLILFLAAFGTVFTSLELIKNEERFHWFSYVLAAPIDRSTLIAERYLFSFLNLSAMMPLTALAIQLMQMFAITAPVEPQLVAVIYGATLIYNCLLLTVALLFNSDIARYVTIVLIVVIFLLGKLSENYIEPFEGLINTFVQLQQQWLLIGLLIATALIINLIACTIVKTVVNRRDY